MYLNGLSNSFTRLVEAFQTPVYTLCSLLLGDGPAAERAAQECFTRAYAQFNEHHSTRDSQNWLLHIAYQQCMAGRALSHRQINRACVRDAQISTGNSVTLQSLLARLEPEDRAIIALSYWYQLELHDIAWVMGMDGETVKSRLLKAQKTLFAQYCQEALCLTEY